MEITRKEIDSLVSLKLSGRLDAVTAVDADKEFATVLESEKNRLLIELTGLDYISSAGLRVLLVLAKRVQQKGGKIALCSMTAGVKEVFEISGFSSIFKIFDSCTDAREYLNS